MARIGMYTLIQSARALANAGTGEFTVGNSTYWNDHHIEDALDDHRRDFQYQLMIVEPTQESGSVTYKRFWTYPYLESGTAAFYLQTAGGAQVAGSIYEVDYQRGLVEFTNDTHGTAFYATGHAYDIHAAAADIWERKAAYAASNVDWSTDNHNIRASQYYDHCMKQASRCRTMAVPVSVTIYRGDTPPGAQ